MNNANARVTKTYRSLNAKQQASLAFGYLSRGEVLEFERVADAVRRKDYSCPDVDYLERLDARTRFAACWGITHWRLRAECAEALATAQAAGRRGNYELEDAQLEVLKTAQAALLALDRTLAELCLAYGMDLMDVRSIAGAKPVQVERDAPSFNEADLAAMRAAFEPLLRKE